MATENLTDADRLARDLYLVGIIAARRLRLLMELRRLFDMILPHESIRELKSQIDNEIAASGEKP